MTRRICTLMCLLMLAACGGGGIALPTPLPSPTAVIPASPTPSDVTFVPLTPQIDPTITLPTTPPLPRVTMTASAPPPPTDTPAATLTPTASAIPSATAGTLTPRVVTVIASGPANLRSGPDTNTALLTQVPPGAEAPVIEPNVAGADGSSRWVRVSYDGQSGYLRSDLVGPPHAPTLTATPSATGTSPPPSATPILSTPSPVSVGASSTPTGAAIIRLIASVSDSAPADNSRVTVTARLMSNDQGVAGVMMETAWHFKTSTESCSGGPSGADGAMSCTRTVSGAAKGYMVTINVTVSYQGQTFRTSTGFTPR